MHAVHAASVGRLPAHDGAPRERPEGAVDERPIADPAEVPLEAAYVAALHADLRSGRVPNRAERRSARRSRRVAMPSTRRCFQRSQCISDALVAGPNAPSAAVAKPARVRFL